MASQKKIPAFIEPALELLGVQALNTLGDVAIEVKTGLSLANIPLAKGAMLQFFYEIEAGCTSIVAQDPQGKIYHARNLDFELSQILERMTIELDFRRGGKTVFYGTTYAGYFAVLTGMKPGVFAVSLDQRSGVPNPFSQLNGIIKGAKAAGFLFRNQLDIAQSFDDAVNAFANTTLSVPSYIIVSGSKAGEGAVISRDPAKAADIWKLDAPNRWFEVETNDDHWKPPADGRRDHANALMNATGQANVNLDTMFSVLSSPPVLAPGTTYTAQMSATTGFYKTTVRTHDRK